MSGPIRNRVGMWRDTEKGIKSRFHPDVKPPAIERGDVKRSLTKDKTDRGDKVQETRLKHYPTINVEFDRVYAGSIQGGLEDAEKKLMEVGFRNGPLAYVEVTEEFGPDDGSYWLHIITETGKIPFIDNRAGIFRRVKDQIHTVVWIDPDRDMVHLGAHREKSAILQPARHVTISDASARRGIRDLRNKWFDTFGEELPRPLEFPLPEEASPVAEEQV